MTEGFRVFSQFLQTNAGMFPSLSHDRFVPRPFQFIIHLSLFHSTLHSLSYLKGVVEQTTNKLMLEIFPEDGPARCQEPLLSTDCQTVARRRL
jgi:hypothetical protein